MLNPKRIENKSRHIKEHTEIVADCIHLSTSKHIHCLVLPVFGAKQCQKTGSITKN